MVVGAAPQASKIAARALGVSAATKRCRTYESTPSAPWSPLLLRRAMQALPTAPVPFA